MFAQAESKALQEERQAQKAALRAAYESQAKQMKQDRALVDAAAARLAEQKREQAEVMRKQEAEHEAQVAQERAVEEARRREIILQLRCDEESELFKRTLDTVTSRIQRDFCWTGGVVVVR